MIFFYLFDTTKSGFENRIRKKILVQKAKKTYFISQDIVDQQSGFTFRQTFLLFYHVLVCQGAQFRKDINKNQVQMTIMDSTNENKGISKEAKMHDEFDYV